jgi:hypothetical protein
VVDFHEIYEKEAEKDQTLEQFRQIAKRRHLPTTEQKDTCCGTCENSGTCINRSSTAQEIS